MSKFCSKCGNPLAENEKFCGKCGNKVEEFQPAGQQTDAVNAAQPQQVQQPVSQQPTVNYFDHQPVQPTAPKGPNPAAVWVKGHKVLLGLIGAAIVAIAAIIIILCNIFKYQVIDPKDIVRVDFYGVNSAGCADATFNERSVLRSHYSRLSGNEDSAFDYDFYQDKIESLKEEDCSDYFNEDEWKDTWTKAGKKSEAEKMMKALLKPNSDDDSEDEYRMSFKLDKKDNLKNGDTVKVTVDYDKDFLKDKNIKLSSDEFEVEVKGLEDGEEINFFDGFNVSFEGADGIGYVNVDRENTKDFIAYSYNSDMTSSYSPTLKNGDKFTVKASLDYISNTHKAGDKVWFKYDKKFYIANAEEETKDFEVTGLKELTEIDPFEGIKVEFNYASPYLSVSKVNTDSIKNENIKKYVDFYRSVDYDDESYKNLKIGDKYKIYAYISSSRANSLADEGYKLAGTPNESGYYEKEFTVGKEAPAYISTENAKAAENALYKEHISPAIEDFKKDKKSGYVFHSFDDGYTKIKKLKNIEYVESYIATNKEQDIDDVSYSQYKAKIVSIYKVTVVNDDNKNEVFYLGIVLGNPYVENSKYAADSDANTFTAKSLKKIESSITKSNDEENVYAATKYNKTK